MVLKNCAPTMAGIKTANMFSMIVENRKEFHNSICELNKSFKLKGVCIIPLKYGNKRALLYMYRPEKLEKDLSDVVALKLLRQRGYPVGDCNKCILELIKRLKADNKFPHEIGLFLGYPPEDVKGFIDNEAKGAKFTGVWKVYGDTQMAKQKFEQYRKCTKVYWDYYQKNNSIEKLIVAV